LRGMLHLRLLLLLSLAMVWIQMAETNMGTYYHKLVVAQSKYLKPCKKESVYIPRTVSLGGAFCAQACQIHENCNMVCPKDASCEVYDLSVVLPFPVPSQLGHQDHLCYTAVPSEEPQPDLARYMPVTATKSFIDGGVVYNSPSSLVSGVSCDKTKSSCYCSERVSNPFIVIYLGQVYTVTEVVIKLSNKWPDYFYNVKIQVGNTDAASEAVFDTFSSAEGEAGETISFTGHNSSLLGSQVRISMTGDSYTIHPSMCTCLIQVFGN
ncbi:unnamed protein product, partial [Meganyctiphanes norvegica]